MIILLDEVRYVTYRNALSIFHLFKKLWFNTIFSLLNNYDFTTIYWSYDLLFSIIWITNIVYIDNITLLYYNNYDINWSVDFFSVWMTLCWAMSKELRTLQAMSYCLSAVQSGIVLI